MDKKTAIYARVSTDEQSEKGYSLEDQLITCGKYADLNNLDVVVEITDEHSGYELDRPGLCELREMMAEGEIDAVIVKQSSRWTRNLSHRLMLRNELKKAGVELHFVTRGKVDNNPQDKLIDNVEGSFDEFWRDMIILYTSEGKNRKAENNKPVLNGPVPFGYKKIGKGRDAYLEVDEIEANVVRNIFNMYVNGIENGVPLTLRQVSAELNTKKIPPPRYKNKIANHWYPESIRRILANEIYIGKMYYGKFRTINDKKVKQPRENWIEIEVPELSIVDDETFKAVKDRSKLNSWHSQRNRKYNYLLASHIRCGSCGYAMYGTTKRANTPNPIKYYRCSSNSKTYFDCIIQNRLIPAEKIEGCVWNWLLDFLLDDRKLEEGLNELVSKRERELEPKLKDLHNLNELIEETIAKIDWLVEEMANHRHETVITAMREKINEEVANRDALIDERERVLIEVSQVNLPDDIREQVKGLAENVRAKMPLAIFENKRQLLDILNVQVTLHVDEEDICIGIDCLFPTDHKELRPVSGQETHCSWTRYLT